MLKPFPHYLFGIGLPLGILFIYRQFINNMSNILYKTTLYSIMYLILHKKMKNNTIRIIALYKKILLFIYDEKNK